MVAKEKANTKQDKDAVVTGKKAEDSPKEVNVLKNETKNSTDANKILVAQNVSQMSLFTGQKNQTPSMTNLKTNTIKLQKTNVSLADTNASSTSSLSQSSPPK